MTWLLRGGLALASIPLAGALIAYLLENPNAGFDQTLPTNPMRPFLSLSGLTNGLFSGQPGAFLTLGIGLLIAIPVARVALAAYYFERAGERELSRFTIATFVLLLVGLFVVGPLLA
ncbi:MAG: DUF1634 domain-containing protein [Thermoplasmata archaeon]|nr:DUF1634 domain-containing protein [Thermoplasmata archaeon]